MKTLLTDRQILRAIYELYYDDFVSFERSNKARDSRIYLPIDIPAVARRIDMAPELVFGRLYYHLAPKHGRTDAQISVPFFEKTFPNRVTGKPDLHVVNFPVLESILANLEYEERKFRLPIVISAGSMVIAIAGVAVNIFLNSPARSTAAQVPTATPITNTVTVPSGSTQTGPTKKIGP
jgi:UDP:flavonoid glycosyltransferase YjiC (YdhE family)